MKPHRLDEPIQSLKDLPESSIDIKWYLIMILKELREIDKSIDAIWENLENDE